MTNQHGTKTFDILVELTRSIRPTWQVPGIQAAIKASLARPLQPTMAELAYALIRCAENPSVSTPAVIPLDGAHWKKTQNVEPLEPIRARKCARCSEFHLPNITDCRPVRTSGKHGAHIAQAREILRDVKAGLCRHSVVPWLCADCTKAATTVVPALDASRTAATQDTDLPNGETA